MIQAETVITKKHLQAVTEPKPLNGASVSGFELKPIDVPAAVALLQSFYDEDEQDQCETWELLERALAEHRP